MPTPRQIAAAYLALQAFGGAAWWAMLFIYPASRGWFWPGDWPEAGLLAFWLPDLALFVGGSAVSAWLLWRRLPGRKAALWVACGATGYAALFCVSLGLMTGEAWLAAAAMAPAAMLTLLVARAYA